MTNLRKLLVQELLKTGVTEISWPERSDGFTALEKDGKEFAHFHNDNELDIRLTRRIIIEEMLSHPTNSANHPNRSKSSAWIEIRFNDKKDIWKIVELVKKLLKK